MILLDANLLIYAAIREMPQHAQAKTWFEESINTLPRVGLPWPSLQSFARLVSNPRVFERPISLESAWRQVEEWLDLPCAWVPLPSEQHRQILARLIPHTSGGPNLLPDAHLAALAMEHGLTLYSTDGDFARFPGLKWVNPLLPRKKA